MVKMYKGDREVNAAPGQVKRLLLAGWSKTPGAQAAETATDAPASTDAANDAASDAPEPAATEAAAENTATNGGDDGEAGEAPADDADADQDDLPLAAETGDAPVA